MTIDWNLVADITVPIVALFLGAWIKRWFEKRPELTSYYGHVSAFKWTDNTGKKHDIFTHAVVVRNAGKKSATNVRFRHQTLPDFTVFPAVDYTVVQLPDGGKEILIPVLVPNEEVTVGYLYFPPLTFDKVNAGIRSDEGFAKAVPVLMQRQYGTAFNFTMGTVLIAGMIAIMYVLISGAMHLLHR
jgi:hypothetical protein